MKSDDINRMAGNLFHAYDIRIDRDDLSDEYFLRLCDAEASYFLNELKANEVLICRDTRLRSEELMQVAINRFSELGFNVICCINPISTCQFYYSISKRPDCAGIMITASHNPRNYTGEKLVGLNAEPIADGVGPLGGLSYIKEAFIKGDCPALSGKGRIAVIQETSDFIDFSIKCAGLSGNQLKDITILVDFMSGSAGNEIMLAFEKLGANIIPINLVANGAFPSGTPNPAVEGNIRSTLAVAQEIKGKFDFLFIFDGDGDRLVIYDSHLSFVSPSIVLTFLARKLSELCGNGNKIGLDPKAVPAVKPILKECEFIPVLIPNGHSLIKKLIEDGSISFAAEETAHYYFKLSLDRQNAPYENTLLIALLFASEWKKDGRNLEKLIEIQNSVFSRPEWSYFLSSEEQRDTVLSNIKKYFQCKGYSIISTLPDGSPLGATILEWRNDNDWCYLTQRSSQSEKGLIRVMVYASSAALLADSVVQIDEIVKGGA